MVTNACYDPPAGRGKGTTRLADRSSYKIISILIGCRGHCIVFVAIARFFKRVNLLLCDRARHELITKPIKPDPM